MKTFTVVRADNSVVRLTADRAETPDVSRVVFYVGDDVVGSFAGFSAFYIEAPAAPAGVQKPATPPQPPR